MKYFVPLPKKVIQEDVKSINAQPLISMHIVEMDIYKKVEQADL